MWIKDRRLLPTSLEGVGRLVVNTIKHKLRLNSQPDISVELLADFLKNPPHSFSLHIKTREKDYQQKPAWEDMARILGRALAYIDKASGQPGTMMKIGISEANRTFMDDNELILSRTPQEVESMEMLYEEAQKKDDQERPGPDLEGPV